MRVRFGVVVCSGPTCRGGCCHILVRAKPGVETRQVGSIVAGSAAWDASDYERVGEIVGGLCGPGAGGAKSATDSSVESVDRKGRRRSARSDSLPFQLMTGLSKKESREFGSFSSP